MTTTEFYEGWTIMVINADGLHVLATKNGRVMELGICRSIESGIEFAKVQIDQYEKDK